LLEGGFASCITVSLELLSRYGQIRSQHPPGAG
jgi:hypothetical protein